MARAFTRAQLAAMSPEEMAAQVDEVNEWLAAGGIDGQAPPPLKRPEGHQFTRAEIDSMTPEAVVANTDAISLQLAAGTVR